MKALFGIDDRVPYKTICSFVLTDSKQKRRKVRRMSSFLTDAKMQHTPKKNALRKMSADKIPQIMSPKKKSPSKISLSQDEEYKNDAAEYLIQQLYLVADVCLDRNYLSIEILEDMYKYDTLISILKLSYVPNRLKAPVCRILKTLYVDREPQISDVYPKYIRKFGRFLSSEDGSIRKTLLSAPNDEFLQGQAEESSLKFLLLQQLISEYLATHFDSRRYDELSAEMMSLLRTLVQFGFYDGTESILDLLSTLITILQERMTSTMNDKHLIKTTSLTNMLRQPRTIVARLSEIFNAWKSGLIVEKDRKEGWMEDDKRFTILRLAELWIKLSDSVKGISFVLLVVMLSTAVVILDLIITDTALLAVFDGITNATIAFFAAELFLRLTAFLIVNRSIRAFFSDRLNIMDSCLVLMDLVLLIFNYDAQYANAGRIIRVVRVLRLLRLIKVLRAVRALRKIQAAAAEARRWKLSPRFKATSKFEVRSRKIYYLI